MKSRGTSNFVAIFLSSSLSLHFDLVRPRIPLDLDMTAIKSGKARE